MRILASLLVAVFCAGCGEDTVTTLPDPVVDSDVDSALADVSDTSEPVDTTTIEETAADSAPVDSNRPDTATTDTGLLDIGGTFSCGSETCGTTLQYCRRATSPGICPTPDSGICPAGCPGCPALSVSCSAMPMKCWAKPSCNCILVETCGSVANGTCMEKDGGFVAGCNGV
jgi:hypothetical protein